METGICPSMFFLQNKGNDTQLAQPENETKNLYKLFGKELLFLRSKNGYMIEKYLFFHHLLFPLIVQPERYNFVIKLLLCFGSA